MADSFADDELKSYPIKNWSGGYNSYTASKSNLNDNEFPVGQNVELDDNGSVTKTTGISRYGAEIASGKAVTGLGWLYSATQNKVIVAAGTHWYLDNGSTTTALTGVTFTDNLPTYFVQAMGSLYGVNKTDTIAYTADGSTITTQDGGRAGVSPVFFNQRLYLIDASTGRIWYSCAYSVTTDTAPDVTIGFFGDFRTKLTGTVGSDFKDGGFIEFQPKGGVMPTNLTVFGNAIRVETENHGLWEIVPAAANTDKSVAHTITQKVMRSNCPSPRGVTVNGADLWYYTGQGLSSYGEQAQFQTPRPATKSGRIRSEMNSVATSLKPSVALYSYFEKVYIAYGTGTYNDHLEKYDNRLNAFSSPITGINISCFLEHVDALGVRRLLAGSSNPSDSYVYVLESGTDFSGSAIDSYFEHKSIDAGLPGRIKYWAFVDVFYTLLNGTIEYTSYIDENTPISGTQQVGGSAGYTVLSYQQPAGSFPVGQDYLQLDSDTSIARSGHFRIELDFTEGDKISTKFRNANLGENFKIDKTIYWYQPSDSIWQT